MHMNTQKVRRNNNNNNCYIALYPVKIYKLAALYIINIKIRLTIKKKKKKRTSTINAYINIKMTKKPGWEEQQQQKSEEEAKYHKCVHRY